MVAQAVEIERPLYAQQWDFVDDPHRYVAFIGGRGSGKTYAGSWKAAYRAMQPGLGMIGAPDFPMLEFGAKRAFLERLEEMRVPFELREQKGLLVVPMTGAEVRFVTMENESRVRGPNYCWGWVDEVEYIADRKVWLAAKASIRHGDNPQLFVSSTPKGRRLAWEEWVQKATPQHRLYKATTHDNVFLADAEDFVAGLGYTGAFFDQEINAEFVGFEGMVWPEFGREKHVVRIDCADWRAILGVDIGTRNPTAILTVRGEPERRHVERELYRAGMSSEEIVSAIESEAERCNPEKIFLDPSAAAYIETLQRHGYPAEKAENEVSFGIGQVATAFAEGMTIDPSCVNLMAEIESYHYPENKTDSDKPVKQFDHACDALRYAVASEANVLTPGVWVLA